MGAASTTPTMTWWCPAGTGGTEQVAWVAAALRLVLTRSDIAAAMSMAAAAAAPGLRWSTVAGQYRRLAGRLIAAAAIAA